MRWRGALSEAKETHWPLRKLGWGERTKVVTRCKSGSSGSRLVLLPGLGRAGSSSQETTETTEQGEVPNQTTGLGGHPATSLVTFVCLPWPCSSTSPGTSLCRQHHGAWGHRLWHGTESVGTADPCATKSCHVAGGVASEMEEVATARISSCHSSCFSVAAVSGEQNPPSHSVGSWAPRG